MPEQAAEITTQATNTATAAGEGGGESRPRDPRSALRELGIRLATRLRPAPLAVVVAGGIVLFAVLGALRYWTELEWPTHLDHEANAPASFSAALLFAASAGAALLASLPDREGRRSLAVLAGFFAFMALDEGLLIHERISIAVQIRWPILYLPVFMAGALAWVGVVRQVWGLPRIRALWLGGAAVWAATQLFEYLQLLYFPTQWSRDLYRATVLFEEPFEMVGSALFAFALLLLVRHRLRAPVMAKVRRPSGPLRASQPRGID